MNIKQFIESGRYGRDVKGRPLVPTRDCGDAVICATDAPGWCSIMGFCNGEQMSWNKHGMPDDRGGPRHVLLPPHSLNETVKVWGIVNRAGKVVHVCQTEGDAIGRACGDRVIELIGASE
jgi:hypothetical protein